MRMPSTPYLSLPLLTLIALTLQILPATSQSLPACASFCTPSSSKDCPEAEADNACLCSAPDAIAFFQKCLQVSCPPADAVSAYEFIDDMLCQPFSVTLPAWTPTSTSTSTSLATATTATISSALSDPSIPSTISSPSSSPSSTGLSTTAKASIAALTILLSLGIAGAAIFFFRTRKRNRNRNRKQNGQNPSPVTGQSTAAEPRFPPSHSHKLSTSVPETHWPLSAMHEHDRHRHSEAYTTGSAAASPLSPNGVELMDRVVFEMDGSSRGKGQ